MTKLNNVKEEILNEVSEMARITLEELLRTKKGEIDNDPYSSNILEALGSNVNNMVYDTNSIYERIALETAKYHSEGIRISGVEEEEQITTLAQLLGDGGLGGFYTEFATILVARITESTLYDKFDKLDILNNAK